MKKRLLIVVLIAALIAALAGVDAAIASAYRFELVRATPEFGVADGTTVVSVTVRLLRGERTVEGHTLYVITDRGRLGRYTTDADGEVTVEYRCYRASQSTKITDVTVRFADEDNSVFVYVPAEFSYTIPMKASGGGEDGMLVDDIFYDV